jgi:uncharacterized protein
VVGERRPSAEAVVLEAVEERSLLALVEAVECLLVGLGSRQECPYCPSTTMVVVAP